MILSFKRQWSFLENKREKTMTATMMPKATERLTNHTLRLTFNRLGSRVTVVRKSMKGVPHFNKVKLARMTKEQREVWFAKKTINCNVSERAKLRKRLDTLRFSKAMPKQQSLFILNLSSISQKKLERALWLLKQEKARRMPV